MRRLVVCLDEGLGRFGIAFESLTCFVLEGDQGGQLIRGRLTRKAAAKERAGNLFRRSLRPRDDVAGQTLRNSTNMASLSSVRACSGVFDTSRRATHSSPLGALNVESMAKGPSAW